MPRGSWKEFKDSTDAAKKVEYNARVEGRWILYTPTFYPTPEVKEWGGRWDGTNRCWRLPRLERMAKKILEFDPKAKVTRDVKALIGKWDVPFEVAHQLLEEWGHDHPSYKNLYPYQVQASGALVMRGYKGKMLILSPGLGKTPTSIVAADLWARRMKIKTPKFLVVCPKALVYNWAREIENWSEHCHTPGETDPYILRRANRDRAGEGTWSITNPEVTYERKRVTETSPMRMTGLLDPVFDQEWDLVILDESVLYKNRKSKRSQIIKSLASKAKQRWELSGAPVTHDNSDIWQQLQIAEPDYFSSFWKFANEFCVVERTPWSQGEIVGSRHGMELRTEFPDMLFVRNQEEVFEDLPQVIWQDVELPLTRRQKKAHDDIMDLWFHELEINADSRVDVSAVIAQLTRLQQVTSNLKNLETTGKHWPDESSKADAVEMILNTDAQFPMLIWTWHRPGAVALKDRIQRMVDGKTKEKKQHPMYGKRVELVQGGTKTTDAKIEAFKAGEVDVLILSIGVGKYGHTLANVRDVIYYDRTWDSDAMFQSLHRYAGARGKLAGYLHNPRVRVLRCRGTVDDFVEMNLAGKLPDMAAITGADLLKILRSLGANFIEVEDPEDTADV